MNRTFVLIYLLIALTCGLTAKSLVVAERNILIAADSTATLYYGFAKGDRVEFSVKVENNLTISSFEVSEYGASSTYNELNARKISSKSFVATHDGIYKFVFSNKAADSRTCKIKISRTAASEEQNGFSSSVYWKSVQDTSYTTYDEKYLIESDTLVQQIYAANPQIAARSNLSTKNYQIAEFSLPANTVSWSFYIGTGESGKRNYENTVVHYSDKLASIVSHIPEYGPLAALALTGVSFFSNNIQGNEDNIQYWFLKDMNDVAAFQNEKKFRYYKRGDVITEASQMQAPLSGRIYLALRNDNLIDKIKLTIRVAAVEVNQHWGMRTIHKMKITSHPVPYLKN